MEAADVSKEKLREISQCVLPLIPSLAAWVEERSHPMTRQLPEPSKDYYGGPIKSRYIK